VNRAFVSLKYPNYRLWFAGQLVSLVGTWMQNTAQAYLGFELTKSPAFLGYVAFAYGVPTWVFMLFAGALVDRVSRRKVLIVTQIVMMILALIMAGLTYLKWLEPWHILVLSGLLGVANSFDAPARQAIASELVDRKDLTNALALNGALFNLGSTLGPAIAGITYAVYGPVWCFFFNGLSFIAVLIALFKMKLTNTSQPVIHAPLVMQLREGLKYVAGHRVIGVLIFLAAAVSLFGISTVTIFPAWAVHELAGDARVAGYLQAGRGVGAVIGAFGVAYFAATMIRGRIIMLGSIILPMTLIGFALIKWLPMSLLFVAIMGFSHIMIMNISNSLIHSEVEDRLRGRVSSIFSLTFFGLMPLGGLMMGVMAERLSETTAVLTASFAFVACTVAIFLTQKHLRHLK
jgi:MFS family permease